MFSMECIEFDWEMAMTLQLNVNALGTGEESVFVYMCFVRTLQIKVYLNFNLPIQ